MINIDTKSTRGEYKSTELGEIPTEWDIRVLGSLIRIRSGTSPSKINGLKEQGKYPFYKVNDLNFNGKYLTKATYNFDELTFEEIKKNTIVFPKRGASIFTNKIAIVSSPGYMDTNLMALEIIDHSTITYEFLYYLLSFRGLVEFADTSSVPQINNKHIEPIKLVIPTLEEQRRIVHILSTVDEQIENVEQLIMKTKNLKKGLMQQLLTKGLNHTEFKQTELGKIPNVWEVTTLKDLFELVERPVKMADEEEYRLVTVKRRHGGIVKRENLLGKEIKVKSQYLIKVDDFLISKRQIVHGACEVVSKEVEGSIVSNEYHTLRAKENLCIEYFKWLSQTQLVMGYFLRSSIGVHIEKMLFKLNDWFKYKVAIPPIDEQKKIAAFLSTVDSQIKSYEQEKEKYIKLKSGLMQQLLTGKKRVTG